MAFHVSFRNFLNVANVAYSVRDVVLMHSRELDSIFGLTDYVPPEDWGPEFPIPGTVRHNVPIPTLYSADGKYDHISLSYNQEKLSSEVF